MFLQASMSNLYYISFLLVIFITSSTAGSYSDKKAIQDELLSSSNYSADIRPLLDQDNIITIATVFELVSIKEINDVVQSFDANGFLSLLWNDEILTWSPSDYGGESYITPQPKNVWRPRMVLLNTMKDRDLFEDDAAPMSVRYDGFAQWTPGSIFPSSCNMDLTKYPFDEQNCGLRMVIMNYDITELVFTPANTTVGLTFYSENGEWEILQTSVTTPYLLVGTSNNMSTIQIGFSLKRRPQFVILSVLLPTVFLSMLNLLVFLIPVDSGEKISYGITVLLALTVFMSIMSAMLPRSSESMPLVIVYIFILLAISVLTVVDSIVIVYIHHLEEKEDKSQKVKATFKSVRSRINLMRRAIFPLQQSDEDKNIVQNDKIPPKPEPAEPKVDMKDEKDSATADSETDKGSVNRYKIIGKYIDQVSFLVFGVMWLAVTLGFFIAIST